MRTRFNRYGIVIILLLLSLCLCVPGLENFPPANVDDAYQLAPADGLFTRGVWGSSAMAGPAEGWKNSRPDTHTYFQPPLNLIIVAASVQLFGWGVWQARLVSVLFGLGTVIVTYALALSLSTSRVTAFLATLLLVTQPVFVYNARQARPESILVFFSVLAVLIYARNRETPSRMAWVLSGLALGGACMSHYNGVFVVLAYIAIVTFFPPEANASSCVSNPTAGRLARFTPILWALSGAVLVSLPYGIYVLTDVPTGFYRFLTQVSVVGKSDAYSSFWEQIRAEKDRYNLFLHDFRFVPWGKHAVVAALLGTGVYVCVRRDKGQLMLLMFIVILLACLAFPSPNKTPVYLGMVLPFVCVLCTLAAHDLYTALRRYNRTLARMCLIGSLVTAAAFVHAHIQIWTMYRAKYRDCNYDAVITEIQTLLPSDTDSVLGRFDFWIGLRDYHYFRRGFRSFQDIAEIGPDVVIHDDLSISLQANSELKQALDDHLMRRGELLGRIRVDPKDYCLCGDLSVYRVTWP